MNFAAEGDWPRIDADSADQKKRNGKEQEEGTSL